MSPCEAATDTAYPQDAILWFHLNIAVRAMKVGTVFGLDDLEAILGSSEQLARRPSGLGAGWPGRACGSSDSAVARSTAR